MHATQGAQVPDGNFPHPGPSVALMLAASPSFLPSGAQVPDGDRPHPEPSLALMLAATGDQGFSRRLSLCAPLLRKGVSTMVLESPFYGARKPTGQVNVDV
mmetsp:Transcript_41408/g.123698  ORF Transcript_41408/g.123698 Transcript_41408/m.123698 type:complete len:101 (+) Transcript_41408:2498-2800(+)|eukprot:365359-Chlamydomonas_euryale.AAC.6